MTVELIDRDRAKYREKTAADGSFVFNKVEGRLCDRARFSNYIVAENAVTVSSAGRNFTP
jgi:hypothetical protein